MSSDEFYRKWTSGQPWFSIIRYWIYSSFASLLGSDLIFTINSGMRSPICSETYKIVKEKNNNVMQQVRLTELSQLKCTIEKLKNQLKCLKLDVSLIKNEYIILERNHIEREKYTKKIKKISEYSLQDILMDDDSICSSSTGFYSVVSEGDDNKMVEFPGLENIGFSGLNLNIIQK